MSDLELPRRAKLGGKRRKATVTLALKLTAFLCLSALLTTVVVASVLDLDVHPAATYHALFRDSSGLQGGDTVRIAGVEVGKVSGVSLLQGAGGSRCGLPGPDPNCALVTFSVDSTQQLSTTTTAAIFFANLLGQRTVELQPGAAGGAPLRAGATIPIVRTQPGLDLTAVFNGFAPLFNAISPDEVNHLTSSVISVFQGQAGTVSNLVQQVATITTNLADRQQILNELLQNLGGLLQSVNTQGGQLGQLIDNFDHLVGGLAGERSQLGSTIDGIGRLNTTVSGLLSQSQPDFNESISGLSSAFSTLSADQSGLDGVLSNLPGLLQAGNKFVSTGSYIDVYLCDLTLNLTDSSGQPPARLNISLVPGQPAPQPPVDLPLPSGPVGDQTQHTEVCR